MADLARLTLAIRTTGAQTSINQLRRLSTAAVRLSRAQVNLQETSNRSSQGINNFTQSINQSSNAVNNLGSRTRASNNTLSSFASSLRTVGRDLIRNFTVPITAAGTAAAMFALDLNQGLANTQSLLAGTFDENTDRIMVFRDEIIDTANRTGQSFNDLTDGLYQSISAFQDGEDAVDRFNIAVNAGIAGAATTSDSVALLSAVTRAYGDTSADALQSVSDLAFETVRLGQTTFPQLASAIQLVTATSNSLSVSQEELFTVFATLTGVTGDASQVATQFRSINASLLNPTAALSALLREQGFASAEAAIQSVGLIGVLTSIRRAADTSGRPLQDYIRRIEGINATTVLTGEQLQNYNSRLNDLQDSAGATDRAFRAQAEGINQVGFQLRVLQQRAATLAQQFGMVLLPGVNALLEAFIDLGEALTDVFGAEFITAVGSVLALAGPLTLLSGQIVRLIALFRMFGAVLPLGALGVVIGLIAALAAGFNLLINRIRDASDSERELTDQQQLTVTHFQRLQAAVSELDESDEDLQGSIQGIIDRFPELIGMVDAGTTSIGALNNAVRELAIQNLTADFQEDFAELFDLRQSRVELRRTIRGLQEVVDNNPLVIESQRRFDAGLIPQEVLERQIQFVEDATFDDQGRSLSSLNQLLEQTTRSYDNIEARATAAAQGIGASFTVNARGPRFFFTTITRLSDETGDSAEETRRRLDTWQEVFARITNTPIERFAEVTRDARGSIESVTSYEGQARRAGEEYLAILEQQREAQREIAENTGETFNELGSAQTEFNTLASTVAQLLNVPAEEILNAENFTTSNEAVQLLVDRMRELRFEILNLEGGEIFDEFGVSLFSLQQQLNNGQISTQEFQVQASQLANTTLTQLSEMFGSNSTQVEAFIDGLRQAGIEINELRQMFDLGDFLGIEQAAQDVSVLVGTLVTNREAFNQFFDGADSLVGVFENIQRAISGTDAEAAELALALRNLIQATVEFTSQALADGFEAIGMALETGANAGEAFGQVIGQAALEILRQLPLFFIQAGLQRIIAGDLGLGLGLIAAGASLGILSGYTQANISTEFGGTREDNAMGNAYGGPLVPFQRGGAFTNTIVNTPTRFRFERGVGLMGESGAEAIVPLRRMAGNRLGVDASGAGGDANVTINVINQSGAQVTTQESDTGDGGRLVEMRITQAVSNVIAMGGADRAMNGRFGLVSRGV